MSLSAAKLITEAFRIGQDSRNVDVEDDYKVLQHYFLTDAKTRIMFQQTLTYGERCEIAQELCVSTLAKLIVIKEDGE